MEDREQEFYRCHSTYDNDKSAFSPIYVYTVNHVKFPNIFPARSRLTFIYLHDHINHSSKHCKTREKYKMPFPREADGQINPLLGAEVI